VSTNDTYDVAVIGSGIGGLTAAALLAKSGRRVLVLEQGDGVGGYAHAFRRGDYLFDPAIHITAEMQPRRLPDVLLQHLGVADRVEWIELEHFYRASYPDFDIRVPLGYDDFVATHVDRFPEVEGQIRKFFKLCAQVHWEAHNMPPQLSFKDLDAAVERFPTLFAYQKSTLADVLEEHFDDDRVKSVLSAFWPYMGEPPSRLSFQGIAQLFAVQVNGSFYCRGSFQSFVDALGASLDENGGQVLLNSRVDKIVVEDGKAVGVEVDGERIRASSVISNADARATFEDLVGVEHLPQNLIRKLGRLELALSAFVLYGVTKLDLSQFGLAHETFVYRHWDHEQTYADIQTGRPGGMWINAPTLVDPSLAPPGEHLLIMSALAKYDVGSPWQKERDRYAEEFLTELERAIPHLREEVEIVEVATPETLERFTLNSGGATYGWANTVNQVASRRLSHLTPIENLYLSGHWTQPGSNFLRVLVSGIHTASIMLARAGEPPPPLHPDDELAPV
jgi:prolycopene isomerase